MAGNNYRDAIELAKQDINTIVGELDKIKNKVVEVSSETHDQLTKAFKIQTSSGLTTAVTTLTDSLKGLNEMMVKHKKTLDELQTKQNALSNLTNQSVTGKDKEKNAYEQLVIQQKKALKNLQALMAEQGKNSAMTQQAQRNYDALTERIKRINIEIQKESSNYRLLNKEQTLQTQSNSQLAGSYGRLLAQQKQIKKELQDAKSAYGTSKESIKALQQEYDDVTMKIKTVNREIEENIKAEQKKANALNSGKSAITGQLGAYDQLVAKQRAAKKAMQDAIVTHGKNSRAAKTTTREYNRLSIAVSRANISTKKFTRGALASAVRGFKNLVSAFGVVGGVMLFASIVKNVFSLTKTFDGLKFALERITKTQEDYVTASAFLNEITVAFGTNLVTTTNRYVKFLAAAKQSGLTIRETESIFRSMTKTAGVLGLKTDELQGIYLALEQMLSKGKVTTEELRRQLGERLPGAMGIMAASMGVTISQLDKMMKKGEVLSAEVLPNFARAVEISFGIESVESVDTLVAAQNRLVTAWQRWIQSIGDSTGWLKDVFAWIGNRIDDMMVAWMSDSELLEKQTGNFMKKAEEWAMEMARIDVETTLKRHGAYKLLGEQIEANKKAQEDATEAEKKVLEKQLDELVNEKTKLGLLADEQARKNAQADIIESRKEYKSQLELVDKLKKDLADAKAYNKEKQDEGDAMNIKPIQLYVKQYEEALLQLAVVKGKFLADRKLSEEPGDPAPIAPEIDSSRAKKQHDYQYELDKQTLENAIKHNEDVIADEEASYIERLAALDKFEQNSNALIVLNRDQEKKVAAEEITDAKKRATELTRINEDAAEKEIRLKQDLADKVNEIDDSEFQEKMNKMKARMKEEDRLAQEMLMAKEDELRAGGMSEADIEKELTRIKNEELKKRLKDYIQFSIEELRVAAITAKNKVQIEEQITELKQMLYDLDLSTEEDITEKKLDLAKDLANELFNVFDNIYSARVQGYEDDIEKNRDHYAAILDNENLSTEQRDAIEAERDRKERELEKKKRKAERQQAVFNKATAAFNTIVKTKEAIVNYASKPATLPLVPFVVAIGAAQLAAIIAQPLPKYEKGKGDYDNYEGMAIWGERRREVKYSPSDNTVEMSPQKIGNHLTYVKKDDVIFPDASKLITKMDNEQIYNMLVTVPAMNSVNDDFKYIQSNTAQTRAFGVIMRSQTDRMVNELKKKKGLRINQNISVAEDIAFQMRKQNTL